MVKSLHPTFSSREEILCIYNEYEKLLCSLEFVLLLRTLHDQCK
jgi:hypothetical protein